MKEFIELNVNTDKMIKSVKHMELDKSIATAFLNASTLEMIWWNANVCVLIKVINESFDKSEKKDFFNRYKFSHHGNNKFILLLRKGVYPFEYMDDWERFNDTSLPEKEDFYSHLNMEEVPDPDDAHTKWVFEIKKDFEIKNLVE